VRRRRTRWLLNPVDLEYAVWTATAEDFPYLGRQPIHSTTSAVPGTAGAPEPDPLDRLARLDAMKAMVDAEQLRLLAAFYLNRVTADQARKIRRTDVGRTAALEVALTRRVGSNTAARQIALAANVIRDYPALLDGLEAGVLTLTGVGYVAAAGEALAPADRETLAKLVADEAAGDGLTPSQIQQVARTRAIELDPAAAAKREASSRRRRSVRLIPLRDGVAELIICTRAEGAVAALDSLTRQARALKATGDPRSLAQLRADLAIDWLTGDSTIPPAAGTSPAVDNTTADTATTEQTTTDSTTADTARADTARADTATADTATADSAMAGGAMANSARADRTTVDDAAPAAAADCHRRWPRPVEVQVVVGADSLLDGGDQPGLLRGYGAISPQLARHLACAEQVWLRQLLADPRDGHLVGMSSRTRLFRGELRAYLQARDQGCAVNPCGRPGEHADHIVSHADGGPTSISSGQLLCAGDNHAKQHPDVTVTRNADDSTTWRMPSGRAYVQHPPPVLGYGTGDPPWHRLFDDPDEDAGDTDDLSPPF
jgi:hypothetical protein